MVNAVRSRIDGDRDRQSRCNARALGLGAHDAGSPAEARWRSGDAADCKSVYAGSIPARASKILSGDARRQLKKPLISASLSAFADCRRMPLFAHKCG